MGLALAPLGQGIALLELSGRLSLQKQRRKPTNEAAPRSHKGLLTLFDMTRRFFAIFISQYAAPFFARANMGIVAKKW